VSTRGVLLLLLATAALVQPLPSSGAGLSLPVISGVVRDRSSQQPIQGATIIVAEARESGLGPRKTLTTHPNGSYAAEVNVGYQYLVLAFLKGDQEAKVEYVPGLQPLSVSEARTYEVSFDLLPAGIIEVDEKEVQFVEDPRPLQLTFSYALWNEAGEQLNVEGAFSSFRELFQAEVGIRPRDILVPAGMPVELRVKASAYVARLGEPIGSPHHFRLLSHEFSVDDHGKLFKLRQGERVKATLSEASLLRSLSVVREAVESAPASLAEMERLGVLATLERRALAEIEALVDLAGLQIEARKYDEAYTNLRDAYLKVYSFQTSLANAHSDAIWGALLLMPFTALIAFTTASLVFDEKRKRIVAGASAYIALVAALSLVYPGYRLVHPLGLVAFEAGSLCLAYFIFFTLPKARGGGGSEAGISVADAVLSALSLGKRSMRRRRLRTVSTLISTSVLVAGFIALTSISAGYGMVNSQVLGSSASEGLLIRDAPPGRTSHLAPFHALDPSLTAWLQGRPDVSLLAPRAENPPSLTPIGQLLSAAGNSMQVYGIVGILPSSESAFSRVDTAVVEGSYLPDDAVDGILISRKAASRLSVQPGDHVEGFDREFTVFGLLDDERLGRLTDLDGTSFRPGKIVFTGGLGPGYRIVECESDELFVTNWKTAMGLAPVVLSRIDARTGGAESDHALARIVVLTRGLPVWESLRGVIRVFFLDSYVESSGATILLPLTLVALNLFVVMLGNVHERRREVFILSTIGMNPSHVTMVFLAEALITGLAGGGLGYLLGLASYRLTPLLSFQLEVYQKIAAGWGLMALFFAVSACVLGALLPAWYVSKIATPSLVRRWKITWGARTGRQPWHMELPVTIHEDMLQPLMDYLERRFRSLPHALGEQMEQVERREYRLGNGHACRLSFLYINTRVTPPTVTRNELIAVKLDKEEAYRLWFVHHGSLAPVISSAHEASIWHTVSFVRNAVIEWSVLPLEEKLRLGSSTQT